MRYIPLPRKEDISRTDYDSEFFITLRDGRFEMPQKILEVYRNRNHGVRKPVSGIVFYSTIVKEEINQEDAKKPSCLFTLVRLFDPRAKNKHLEDIPIEVDRDNCIIIPENYLEVPIFGDRIALVGNANTIEIWNQELYRKFDELRTRGVDLLKFESLEDGLRAVYHPHKA